MAELCADPSVNTVFQSFVLSKCKRSVPELFADSNVNAVCQSCVLTQV